METRRAPLNCSASIAAPCIGAWADTPRPAANLGRMAPRRTEPAPAMNSALLLASVDALLDCKDLEELANSVALLAQRLIGASQAIVILRSAEREHVSDEPSPGEELRSWASAWLESSLPERQVSSGGYRAASIDVPELTLQGLIAVSCEQEDVGTSSSTAQERQQLLAAVAHLTATCSGQIVRRTLADRTLQ